MDNNQSANGTESTEQVSASQKGQTVVAQEQSNVSSTTQQAASTPMASSHQVGTMKFAVIGAIILLVLSTGGAVVYAWQQGYFTNAPYGKDGLLAGLAHSFDDMHTGQYTLRLAIASAPKDATATPFDIKTVHTADEIAAYKNDAQRATDVSDIMMSLDSYFRKHKTYPASLSVLSNDSNSDSFGDRFSMSDPKSGANYAYQSVSGGKDYHLTVSFDTADAIDRFQQMSESMARLSEMFPDDASTSGMSRPQVSTSTEIIVGNAITFTKDSVPYFFLSDQPPQTPAEQISEIMKMAGKDIAISLTASGTSNWIHPSDTDGSSQVRVEGNLGDMSFIVDFQAIVKAGIYYIRINNLPNVFGVNIDSFRSKWMKFDPVAEASSSEELLGVDFGAEMKKITAAQSDQRAQITDGERRIMTDLVTSNALVVNAAPVRDNINNEVAYRYDLSLQKEGLQKFISSVASDSTLINDLNMSTSSVQQAKTYSQGDEFGKLVDYYRNNTTLSVWVDTSGHLRKISWFVRYVPSKDSDNADTDKEVVAQIDAYLSHINEPLQIDAPQSTISLIGVIKKEFMGGLMGEDSTLKNASSSRDSGL